MIKREFGATLLERYARFPILESMPDSVRGSSSRHSLASDTSFQQQSRTRRISPTSSVWNLISALVLPFVLLGFVQQAETTWWFISQTGNASGSPSPRVLCNNIPGLVRRQRLLCERNSDLMRAVADGAALGIHECQFQFRDSRWNCSVIPRDTSVFGRHVLRSTRESSFVHALNSAAVVYAVTRACNKGDLAHCECDPTKKGEHEDRRGQFTWGGCSDNLRYSSSFARRFIDASEKGQRDVKSKTVLHNNRVGRKSIRKQMRLQCKCHGVSGSCTYRTCWLTMAHFRVASEWLKYRYGKAVRVVAKPQGTGFLPKAAKRKLRKIDLIYLERSPDYCHANPRQGLLGTAGRECNATSSDSGGCSSLCCGRGFHSKKQLVMSQCECSFKWCCYVSCKTCEVWKTFHFCNSHSG